MVTEGIKVTLVKRGHYFSKLWEGGGNLDKQDKLLGDLVRENKDLKKRMDM